MSIQGIPNLVYEAHLTFRTLAKNHFTS